MLMEREKTRRIKVGKIEIGGGAPISVQSMTKTDTRNVEKTISQIKELVTAGCEIVRIAIPDEEAASAFSKIRRKMADVPLVADIHFNYRLALLAIEAGADKIRINPGNIGGEERVREVVKAAKERGIPIRIGVNAGSLSRELLRKYGHPTPEAMVESALSHIRMLEDLDFRDIIISLKSSDVETTIRAYQLISEQVDYPLHLGITEAGGGLRGVVKSAVGLSLLLAQGIGDTIRVSLTGDPVDEVRVGYYILSSLGIRKRGVEIISCPTCGRCEINVAKLATEVEKRLSHITFPLKVAIMGCVVNGPGEAREADVGFAGGKGEGIIFRRGEIIRKVKEKEAVETLVKEVEKFLKGISPS